MKIGLTIGGLDRTVATIQRSRARMADRPLGVMKKIGDDILAESNMLVPVDTGTLKASGRVRVDRDRKSNQVSISVNYGVDIPIPRDYAMAVHERLDVVHRNGQAKFLETAYLNQLSDIPEKFRQGLLDDDFDEGEE